MTKKLSHKPQKFKWTKKRIFSSFKSADELRNTLKKSGEMTKIRRCGPGGTLFKVLTGSPIKNKKKTKEENNAAE